MTDFRVCFVPIATKYFCEMDQEGYMRIALQEAQKALDHDEVPIGALVVIQNRIVARAYNQVELLKDSTAHAEILALTSAFQAMGAKYLPEATLFVTVEPCLMCAGAMYWSKIGGIIFGAFDEKNGYRRCTGPNKPFHPRTTVREGILEGECTELMQRFFAGKRNDR